MTGDWRDPVLGSTGSIASIHLIFSEPIGRQRYP